MTRPSCSEDIVNKILAPYSKKTKFLIDNLIDYKNTPGSTMSDQTFKEFNIFIYNQFQKKKLQIIDDIKWKEQAKDKHKRARMKEESKKIDKKEQLDFKNILVN